MVDGHMYPVRVIQETTGRMVRVCEGRKQVLVLVCIIRNMSITVTLSSRIHSHKDVISIINMRERLAVIIDPVEATVVHIHHHHL